MVICLELGADLHMAQLMPLPLTVSCFSKIQIGFTFLVLAHLGSPGQRAVKRVYVKYSFVFSHLFLVYYTLSLQSRNTVIVLFLVFFISEVFVFSRLFLVYFFWWGAYISFRLSSPYCIDALHLKNKVMCQCPVQ